MKNAAYIYLEDCKPGDAFTSGPIAVTQEDIIAYARQFDPQPFHLDPEAAKKSTFGELVASGWHTASLTMRLINEAVPPMDGGMIGRQVKEMNWPRPVRPGDKLSWRGEILEARPSASNARRGTLRLRSTTTNQRGEAVMEGETLVLIPRRVVA